MNDTLRVELIEMARAEDAMRADVPGSGDLELQPIVAHHELTALRKEHNTRLRQILDDIGWPGEAVVGADGADAAWRLAMFASDDRELQGRCLLLMEDFSEDADVAAHQPAFLLDRLLVADGKPQIYGSQCIVSPEGIVPCSTTDSDGLDARRAAIGCEPIAVALERIRKEHA